MYHSSSTFFEFNYRLLLEYGCMSCMYEIYVAGCSTANCCPIFKIHYYALRCSTSLLTAVNLNLRIIFTNPQYIMYDETGALRFKSLLNGIWSNEHGRIVMFILSSAHLVCWNRHIKNYLSGISLCRASEHNISCWKHSK